jgi:hypothetical protein
MNNISKNLKKIKNLDTCLTIIQKQEIIQRLLNHNQFYEVNLKFIFDNLFAQNLKELNFYKCDQINDHFLRLLTKQCKFQLKLLKINRCYNVSGKEETLNLVNLKIKFNFINF